MSGKPSIILLKTPRTRDPYLEIFESAGFRVSAVPVLEFEYIHAPRLRDRLTVPEQYDGLITTSPRAVEALRRLRGAAAAWGDKFFFAAGPETARRAAELGFSVRGREAGSAGVLANLIIEHDFEKPLLFLSGNRRRDTLPDRLNSANISFEELVVYETHLRRRLEWPFDPEDAPEWVVFFSPSGIEAVQEDDRIPWEHLRTAAIGSTTAGALRERGWIVDAVAEAPEPEALYRAVVEAT